MAPRRNAVRVLEVCFGVFVSLAGTLQSTASPRDRVRVSADSDSVRVVAAGVRALGGKQPTLWRVGSFQRDSAGVLLSLIPPCPRRMTCQGGGGRVRVRAGGRATVLERYR